MARRAIIIGAVVLGLILLANLILLAIYLPRLIKTPVSQVFPSPAAPSPIANSSPSIGVSLVPKRSAKPDGELVQRTEVSPSGNIKVNYVRRKGDPTRRIILESSASGSSETRPLFEHQRNAWVVISPNDE